MLMLKGFKRRGFEVGSGFAKKKAERMHRKMCTDAQFFGHPSNSAVKRAAKKRSGLTDPLNRLARHGELAVRCVSKTASPPAYTPFRRGEDPSPALL